MGQRLCCWLTGGLLVRVQPGEQSSEPLALMGQRLCCWLTGGVLVRVQPGEQSSEPLALMGQRLCCLLTGTGGASHVQVPIRLTRPFLQRKSAVAFAEPNAASPAGVVQGMTARIAQLTLDAHDVAVQSSFWSRALGLETDAGD